MSDPKEKLISLYRGDTASKEFFIENIDPADFSAISVRLEAKRADNKVTVIGFDILDSDSGNDWPNNILVANFLSAYTQTIEGEGTIILKYDIEVTRVNGSVVEVTTEYFGLITLEADVTVGNSVVYPATTADIYSNLASLDNAKGAGYIGVKSSLWSGIATTVQGALEWLKGNYIQFTGTFSAGKLLKSAGSAAQATVSGISISSDDALSGIKSASVADAPTTSAHLTRKDYVDAGLSNKEDVANKSTNTSLGTSDSLYPSQNATKTYVDTQVTLAAVGFLKDRGNYNASSNLFPSSGGSGVAGAILKGDLWTISVAGTLGGNAVTAGDVVRALADTPGQTSGNWAVSENNIGYVSENSANKNQNSGYAGLDSSGNFVQNSDKLSEGSTNLFFTAARAIASVLTGFATASGLVTASDTILQAIGKLQYQISNISGGLPVGTSIESACSSAPTDYLEEDGSALSRTTYATLFAAIGTTYGVGDGSTTFNIPDRRGNVGRGAGTSVGYTQNVSITQGSKTDDALQGFAIKVPYRLLAGGGSSRYEHNIGDGYNTYLPEDDGTNGTPRVANETRVKSLGMKYFIKYQ